MRRILKMKMDKMAGSKNDEYYTPPYAILPIMEYIPKGSTVWFPFDTEESHYVKLFREDYHVIRSHIDEGLDFFKYMPLEKIDYIISNPPYSLKGQVFERLFDLGIPFAMLVGVVGLFESKHRFNLFKNNEFELMYFDKRVKFMSDYKQNVVDSNPPFSSVYVCHKVLPEKMVFKVLKDKMTLLS